MDFLENIFSIKKHNFHKIITILGIKLKIRNKKKELVLLEKNIKKLNYKILKYCPENKRKEALKDWYFECTGKTLNIDNPQTFNEKIQWLKLYDSTPLKTKLADKYLVREWVKETIGEEYLIPILGVWDSFDEIDFDKLPDQFVLKCNHGSGYNIVVKDKNELNIKQTRNKINKWMNEDYGAKGGFELHYSDIPRKIIAEYCIPELLEGAFCDYHFFCFNGEPKMFYVVNAKDCDNRLFSPFFDMDCKRLKYTKDDRKPAEINIDPEIFSKAKSLVTQLCKGFIFVRVDLYLTDKQIYFGEMTFTSSSGIGRYCPDSWEMEFGNLIKLQGHTIMTLNVEKERFVCKD